MSERSHVILIMSSALPFAALLYISGPSFLSRFDRKIDHRCSAPAASKPQRIFLAKKMCGRIGRRYSLIRTAHPMALAILPNLLPQPRPPLPPGHGWVQSLHAQPYPLCRSVLLLWCVYLSPAIWHAVWCTISMPGTWSFLILRSQEG